MYHRGTYSDLLVPSTNRNIHLSLMPNPSHLEGKQSWTPDRRSLLVLLLSFPPAPLLLRPFFLFLLALICTSPVILVNF